MNLSVRANSAQEALVEALEYYQDRLIEVESQLSSREDQVNRILDVLGASCGD